MQKGWQLVMLPPPSLVSSLCRREAFLAVYKAEGAEAAAASIMAATKTQVRVKREVPLLPGLPLLPGPRIRMHALHTHTPSLLPLCHPTSICLTMHCSPSLTLPLPLQALPVGLPLADSPIAFVFPGQGSQVSPMYLEGGLGGGEAE